MNEQEKLEAEKKALNDYNVQKLSGFATTGNATDNAFQVASSISEAGGPGMQGDQIKLSPSELAKKRELAKELEGEGEGAVESYSPSLVLKQGTATPEITEAATLLDTAQTTYSASMSKLTDAQKALSGVSSPPMDSEGNPIDPTSDEAVAYLALLKAVDDADLEVTQSQANLSTAQKRFETTDVPSTGEALGKAISTPSAILSQPTVYGLEVKDNQIIDSTTGQEKRKIP